MSVVNILNIQVLDNPSRFTNPFQFEITFECTSNLQEDLEWKIVYVGSAEDERYDQTLDCIMVGPVPVGINKFVFQADAPNVNKIPPSDITGVTVVLLVCGYRGQEFVRVGYYVNNEYDEETLRLEPPTPPQIDRLIRNILADKPRVTRFPIRWDAVDELEPPPPQPDLPEELSVGLGDEGGVEMLEQEQEEEDDDDGDMAVTSEVDDEEDLDDEDDDNDDDNEEESIEDNIMNDGNTHIIKTTDAINLTMNSSPEHTSITTTTTTINTKRRRDPFVDPIREDIVATTTMAID